MSQIFFTSDLHLGHKKVSEIRGFESAEEHDEVVLLSIRNIPTGSELWVLGDISGGSEYAEDIALDRLEILSALNDFTMHLIPGNHDSVHPMHRDSHKKFEKFMETFYSIQAFARRKLVNQKVLLSHFPYAGDSHGPERYKEFRLRDEGHWLLHGHTHSLFKTSPDHPKQISVGWDAWRRPVELNEIAKIIQASADVELVNKHITV